MGFLILLVSLVLVRIVWRFMSRRSVPKFEGEWRSVSYRNKIAASASDYRTRQDFAAMRGHI